MTKVIASKSNRIPYLDATKAFAMFLVILAHLIQFAINYGNSVSWKDNSLFLFIVSFHMPLFFFISGIFLDSKTKRGGLHKLQALLLPNFGWNIICLILGFQIYGLHYGHHFWQDVIYMVFIQGHYWFLPSLFCCYIISWIAIKLTPNKWCAAFISCLLVILLFPGGYKSYNIATFLPFFWGGYLMKKLMLTTGIYKKHYYLLIACGLGFLLLYKDFSFSHTIYATPLDFQTILSNTSNLITATHRWLIGFCGTICIVLSFKLLYTYIQIPRLSDLGKFTIGAYLMHMPLMDILHQWHPFPDSFGVWNDYVILPLIAAALQCLLAILQYFITKNGCAGLFLFGKPIPNT